MENLSYTMTMYNMAIEHGDYRRALVFAIREYRRTRDGKWALRVRGCFTRRNRT